MKSIKMLISGNPGIGKTVLMGSTVDVPEMLPALLIDFEGNTDSIESKCHYISFEDAIALIRGEFTPIENKLHCVRLRNTKNPRTFAFDSFVKLFEELEYNSEAMHVKTVLVDSLTRLNENCLQKYVETLVVNRTYKGVPDFPDYKNNYTAMMNVCYRFQDTDYNIIFSAHLKEQYSKDGKTLEAIQPALTGQLMHTIPGLLKTSVVLTSTNDTRVLRTQPFGMYSAKDCSEGGKLGDRIPNPTMKHIYTKLVN